MIHIFTNELITKIMRLAFYLLLTIALGVLAMYLDVDKDVKNPRIYYIIGFLNGLGILIIVL